MIRRTVSSQGLRLDVDPLEERKLLSTFDGFNSSQFIGPLPFQQVMPVVFRVGYAPPFAVGDPYAMMRPGNGNGNGAPGPRNDGGGPIALGQWSGHLDPGQGMMPPGPDHNPPFLLRIQALFDWLHGQAPADMATSETLFAGSATGSPPVMIHSESLSPNGSMTTGMSYAANDLARTDFPGGPSPHGPVPGPALTFDNSESMNASLPPGMGHAVFAFVARTNLPSGPASRVSMSMADAQDGFQGIGTSGNLNFAPPGSLHGLAGAAAEAAAALAAAGMESNATANMARNGDPAISHAIVGPATSSSTPIMPRTALTLSSPFNDQAMSISSPASGDPASTSRIRRNTSIQPESERLTDRVIEEEKIGQPLEFEATVGVIAARGTELLSQFLPGDVSLLGNAVDKFLDRLHGLGDGLPISEDSASAPARIQWPIAVTLGAVILEIGRRRYFKREDDESAGSGFAPGSRLAGWPGSWTARVP